MPSIAVASPVMKMHAAPALGAQAARGAFWTILFSILGKCITLTSQIALAWFLVPEDFGLVAMALSVTNLTAVVGSGNLRNILLRQNDSFEEQAGQMFWLSLTLNVLAMVVLSAFSPLAGTMLHEPRVIPLILLAVAAAPIQSLTTIYSASLLRDLRFRHTASIQLGAGAVQQVSAVTLAWLGFGPYSLILPILAVAFFCAVANRFAAGRIAIPRPQPRKWQSLRGSVGWLMANAFFTTALIFGPSFVIGVVEDNPQTAGYYFWGFSISVQAIFLVATSLQGVLFPVLTKLNDDPARQFQGVAKACQTLTAAVVPVCMLQILLAGPVIKLIFHERWYPAVPVVQWLSFGLLTQPLNILAISLLLARGRYRRLALLTMVTCTAVLTACAVGAKLGDQADIAALTGSCLFAGNLMAGWILFREFGHGWRELARWIARPFLCGLTAAILGYLCLRRTGEQSLVAQMSLVLLVSCTVYASFFAALLRPLTRELTFRLKVLVSGRDAHLREESLSHSTPFEEEQFQR